LPSKIVASSKQEKQFLKAKYFAGNEKIGSPS